MYPKIEISFLSFKFKFKLIYSQMHTRDIIINKRKNCTNNEDYSLDLFKMTK